MQHEIFNGLGLMYMLSVAAMLLVVVAMFVDLISGIRKAKVRGELRTSYGLSRSFNKFLIYEGILLICTCIDSMIHFIVYMMTDKVYMVPVMCLLMGIVLCAVEGWSVYEKAEEKQRRKILDVAAIAANLADRETLAEIIKEAVQQSLQEKTK